MGEHCKSYFASHRLLLRILQQQQASFVLQQSEKSLQMSKEALERLNPKETTLQALTEVMGRQFFRVFFFVCVISTIQTTFGWIICTPFSLVHSQVMSEDLIPDKMREDYQDGESLASVCLQSFRERWWNKVLLTGALETDGVQTKP